MSKTMTRRIIAGASAVAVAAGMAVTMGAGAAGAEEVTESTTSGQWTFKRKVSNTTPKPGDVIHVRNDIRWNDWYAPIVSRLKEVHDPCLTYVPGSAKVNGGNPGLEINTVDAFVLMKGTWSRSAATRDMNYTLSYTVGENCARDVDLGFEVHLGADQNASTTARSVGPSISLTKNTTSMSVGQVNSPEVGKATQLSAKVLGSHAGDTVEFFVQDVHLGSAPVNAEGWAYLDWTPSSAGNKTIRASYPATPFSNAAGPVTANTNVVQGNVASGTSLDSVTGAQVGRASTLTATVTATGGTASPAGGKVEFYADNLLLGLGTVGANGKATYAWSPTAPGNISVTAKFLGHGGVGMSDTSRGVVVAAAPAGAVPSSVTLRVGGAPQVGAVVQLIANVDPKDAGGEVVFSDNGVQVGTAVVNEGGVAVFDWTPTEAGPRDLNAAYSGNGLVVSSVSETVFMVVAPGVGNPGGDGGDGGGSGSLGSLDVFGSLGNLFG